jgi:hypothetical protein
MNETRIIAELQDALTKHFWPEYPVVGGTVTARCHCGANIRTTAAWLEHLKAEVIPKAVRAQARAGSGPADTASA